MSTLILYGVTENAKDVLFKLKNKGLNPECFCDENPEKVRGFHHDLPVLSIKDIKDKYTDYQIYVTTREPEVYEVINRLIDDSIFTENQIANEIKEKYYSCDALEYELVALKDGIQNCCGDNSYNHFNSLPSIKYRDENMISHLLELKKKIIQNNKDGKTTCCTKCPNLREGYWPKAKKIRKLNFSIDNTCNLKCTYCYKAEKDYVLNNKVDIVNTMDHIMGSELIHLDDIEYPIYYASGEIAIHPDVDRILDRLQKFDVSFFTNATKYNEHLHEIIKKPLSCAIISLDCGIRETYKKIKQVDLFDTVCENIAKYSSDGGNIMLKYIVMEDNSDTKNLDGFIEICMKNNIKNIRIARDWRYETINEVNIATKNVAMKLMLKAIKHNINYFTGGETILNY